MRPDRDYFGAVFWINKIVPFALSKSVLHHFLGPIKVIAKAILDYLGSAM